MLIGVEFNERSYIRYSANVFWGGLFAYSMYRDRSRYRNVVLLLLTGMSVLGFIYSLFSSEVSGVLVLITMALVGLAFLILPFFLFVNGLYMIKREGGH